VPAEYRTLANAKQFNQFLDGDGTLTNRDNVAAEFDYDWHARKLTFEPHFRSQVLLHLTNYRSARDIHWAMQNDPLFQANGAQVEISVPGLTQANAQRPLEPYLVMLQQVLDTVAELPHRRLRAIDRETWTDIVHLFGQLDIFDATRVKLPPTLSEWAKTNPNQSSFKLHLRVSATGQFKQIQLTPFAGNDNAYLRDFLGFEAEPGHIDLFDAGYFEVQAYHDLNDAGNYFVTKHHGRLAVTIQRERELPTDPIPGGYVVLADQDITLGDDQTRWYRSLLVRLPNGKEIRILTNMLLPSAAQICLLYHYRWSIEILFRWLKSLLQLDQFISRDPQGILRQVLTALIVYGLLVIFNQDPSRFSPKQLWRQLQADIHQAIFEEGYRLGLQHGRQQVDLHIT
jgi:hypothetical protein